MTDCDHENFAVEAEVNRLTDVEGGPVTAFTADIRIVCSDCGMPFCFRGMPLGLSHLNPTMSFDSRTACLPIHPEDDPTTGIGSPGFSVKFHD